MPGAAKPKSFASRAQFRAWLERHHASAAELNLRLFKVHARERGVTYREALDEALCFGWIDGVRRALDDDSFTQRFSPRRRGSKWSMVNRRRMRELQAEGLLAAPGLAAWQAASKKPAGYSFESKADHACEAVLVATDRERQGALVLSAAGALVPAHQQLLGDEREAGSNTTASARAADRVLRAGATDRAAGAQA